MKSLGLTAKQVAAIKGGTAAKTYEDGQGLRLVVQPSGAKSWVCRLQRDGHRTERGLGSYPAVSLAGARTKAAMLRGGQVWASSETSEPDVPLALAPAPVSRSPAVTFEELARTFHKETDAAGGFVGKTSMNWLGRMERWVFPLIGHLEAAAITAADLANVLRPLVHMAPSAKKIRGNIRAVMDRALVANPAMDDPAKTMKLATLALPKVKHAQRSHPAMRLDDVPGFLRDLQGMHDHDVLLRAAMIFTVLTAKRSGEVRLAKWCEIDLNKREWTIPAERMKAGKPHREPLTRHAVAVLAVAQAHRAASQYVFPNRATGEPFSDMGMLMVLRRANYRDAEGQAVTVHGFRATFSTWATEVADYPDVLSEIALAHGDENKVRDAYKRGTAFAKRAEMMGEWTNAAVGYAPAPDRLLLAA